MRVIPLILLFGLVGCGDTIVNIPPNPTNPDPVKVTSKIEYRVSGNAVSVRVRYANEQDGLIQTVTTLPFFTNFFTTDNSAFLSLEVTPLSFYEYVTSPFISVQIFVNGSLFREATSNTFVLQTISVDGTWRR